jgi:hypothetical protein
MVVYATHSTEHIYVFPIVQINLEKSGVLSTDWECHFSGNIKILSINNITIRQCICQDFPQLNRFLFRRSHKICFDILVIVRILDCIDGWQPIRHF